MTNPSDDPPSPSAVEHISLAGRDDGNDTQSLVHCDEAEEKPPSPSVTPTYREVSEDIKVADNTVETQRLEEEAIEAVMSNENEEFEEAVMGMETADAYAACRLSEAAEAAEVWKVEEDNHGAKAEDLTKAEEEAGEAVMSNENQEFEKEFDKVVMGMETSDAYAACRFREIAEAEEAWKVEEEIYGANAEDITKAEEEANVTNTAEDITKVEEETGVANIADDYTKVEEETHDAINADDNTKVEEETDDANAADDNTKVEEETGDANIADDNTKVEEETEVANIADDNTKVEEDADVADIAEDIKKVKEDADVTDIVDGEVDEAAMPYEKEEAEEVVARMEPADTHVACSPGETTGAVEIREVDEAAGENGMPDENEEAEKVAVGMEMGDGSVPDTLDEPTEADGVGMGAEDEEEEAEELNAVGTAVEGTTDTEEDADEAGGREEALEAEEVEVANEADLMEEEVDGAEMAEYAGSAELNEETEMEIAEEEGRSVSSGKRKRGKNSKSAARVPVRKKMEEDVCFICFDGGELVLCDRRGCPKAYHPTCVNRDDAFFRAKGKWNCGWHLCSNCGKSSYYMCYTCTFSLCKGCTKDAVILCVRGKNGFCETCMRTVMLIEQNELGSKDSGQVDFDDKSSWEYLFKDYYTDLKGKLSLTYDELAQAKNPWKGSDILTKQESPDEPYEANNDGGLHSDSSSENIGSSSVKRRKASKRLKSRSNRVNSRSTMTSTGDKGAYADERSDWASKELLEFVMHMRNGDKSILSQFDVQALLLEYIKRNKLRDPRRKSQIICDARLQNLFGKPRVGHFEMLKLLESHFLLKEDSQTEDQQGSVVDTEVNHLEGDGNIDSYQKTGKDKRRKTRKKSDERGLQSNTDDYAAIDNHNINLIYLRRNLVEELLEDTDKFHDKVVGSFVRIRISGSGQKQDLYRLVQVVGTCKAAEPYKVGKRMTDTLLEILNLSKTEIVSIDIISNQEFTEDECKRLRQSIKCGLINRLTVGDIQDKAMALQAVRVKDWLETEIVRLSHLRDRASEKGRRKELRECVEKLQLLKTPEERQRRLEEIPEIHADPNMDPSYESEEEEETVPKRSESYMRPRGIAFDRRGRETVSPRTGGSNSNESWSGARNYSNMNRELSRNLSNKGLSVKFDGASSASEVLNDVQMLRGRESETQPSNSWEGQKLYSSLDSGKSIQPVVASEPLSTTMPNASAASSTGIALPAVKINETEKMWHYKDPSGKVQGPFSMAQLRKWNNTGYFPADLRIWRTPEKPDESLLLTDALAGNFSKEPSAVDKTFPMAQTAHNLNYGASPSGKLHLPAQQGVDAQVGGRSTFDRSSGFYNSHNAMGSLGQATGGNWRYEDNNSVANRPPPMTVEIPKIPTSVRGPDVGIRIESTNLPSPTPQTTSYGTKEHAFENKWSPTPVHSTGSLVGSPFPGGHGGMQTHVAVEKVVRSAESGSSSQTAQIPAPNAGIPHGHPQATMVAPITADASRNTGADIKIASMQNLAVSDHNSHAEAQGWGSGLVQKPEMAGSIQIRGGEPQVWGSVHSRVESNHPAAMPAQPLSAHGHWTDASSIQNAASFNSGNPMGNLPMPGMQDSRPPTSSNQPNIPAALPANMPWGMTVAENQNTSWGVMSGNPNLNWGGPPAANMNMNWMPGQGPAPGNANPGWAAPSQGPSSVISTGWAQPGQGHPNANGGWVVPGQGSAPGGANPGWVAPAAGQGMWGNEQNHNGDRFPNQRDRGPHGGDKTWNRQSSFGGGASRGGGSSGPPFGTQRGVCKFHESGHCRKGAFCEYLHT